MGSEISPARMEGKQLACDAQPGSVALGFDSVNWNTQKNEELQFSFQMTKLLCTKTTLCAGCEHSSGKTGGYRERQLSIYDGNA